MSVQGQSQLTQDHVYPLFILEQVVKVAFLVGPAERIQFNLEDLLFEELMMALLILTARVSAALMMMMMVSLSRVFAVLRMRILNLSKV